MNSNYGRNNDRSSHLLKTGQNLLNTHNMFMNQMVSDGRSKSPGVDPLQILKNKMRPYPSDNQNFGLNQNRNIGNNYNSSLNQYNVTNQYSGQKNFDLGGGYQNYTQNSQISQNYGNSNYNNMNSQKSPQYANQNYTPLNALKYTNNPQFENKGFKNEYNNYPVNKNSYGLDNGGIQKPQVFQTEIGLKNGSIGREQPQVYQRQPNRLDILNEKNRLENFNEKQGFYQQTQYQTEQKNYNNRPNYEKNVQSEVKSYALKNVQTQNKRAETQQQNRGETKFDNNNYNMDDEINFNNRSNTQQQNRNRDQDKLFQEQQSTQVKRQIPKITPQNIQKKQQKQYQDDIQIKPNRVIENIQNFDDKEELDNEDEELYECAQGCGRKFRKNALVIHERVCADVFQKKRKEFNSVKQRAGEIIQQLKKNGIKQSSNNKNAQNAQKQGKDPKWKVQSEMLRIAMKQNKGQKVSEEEQLKVKQQADDLMIQCKFCNRKFNQQAGERHIPFCEEKSKKSTFNTSTKKK